MNQGKKYNAYLKKKNYLLGTSFRSVSQNEIIDFSEVVETAVSIAKIEMLLCCKEVLSSISKEIEKLEEKIKRLEK